jgi:LPPG:FO 2-phospho-L-lactate transferase
MSDQAAPTMIETDNGLLPFQSWFVRERWQPAVREVCLPADVRATPQVMHALENADFVIIAPSNPFVSIDPILNVYPIREMVMDLPRAVLAVTPIIGDKALKGPAAKMMAEMNLPVSAAAVAGHYGDLIDGFVIDQQDRAQVNNLNCAVLASNTIMNEGPDRVRLAVEVLDFARQITN